MKSRELRTIHNLIATNYKIEPIENGKFRHSFRPKNTDTVYEFIANGAPEIEEGQRYNIGYTLDLSGRNIIDISCLSKNEDVNPMLSYLCAKQESRSKSLINRHKNDTRVDYDKSLGYHWGPKYAYREYGLALPENAFRKYIDEIEHPKIPCVIADPDDPRPVRTFAYADEGLEEAIFNLIQGAVKVNKIHYELAGYNNRFTIRGIEAITDKK